MPTTRADATVTMPPLTSSEARLLVHAAGLFRALVGQADSFSENARTVSERLNKNANLPVLETMPPRDAAGLHQWPPLTLVEYEIVLMALNYLNNGVDDILNGWADLRDDSLAINNLALKISNERAYA